MGAIHRMLVDVSQSLTKTSADLALEIEAVQSLELTLEMSKQECTRLRDQLVTFRNRNDNTKRKHQDAIDTVEAMLRALGWDGTLETLNAAGSKPRHFASGIFEELKTLRTRMEGATA